jgi:hypothetical protein
LIITIRQIDIKDKQKKKIVFLSYYVAFEMEYNQEIRRKKKRPLLLLLQKGQNQTSAKLKLMTTIFRENKTPSILDRKSPLQFCRLIKTQSTV